MSQLGQLETFPALSRMSAAGGEADVFRQKADFGTRMSAVRGKADVPATWPGSPLLARIASEAVLVSIKWMNNSELDWLQQRPFFACPGGQK